MNKKGKFEFDIVVIETAFKNRLLTLSVNNNLNYIDPKLFLENISEIFPDIMQKINLYPCKINTSLVGVFVMPKGEDQTGEIKYINTKNVIFLENYNPIEWYNENEQLLKKISEFTIERGSGYALKQILRLEIKINKCSLFSQGGNSTYIDLPNEILNKKACVNIKSNDHFCFAWSVACSFQNITRNVSKVSSYEHYSKFLNLDGIEFPFALKQLNKFEEQNNLSVNVFALKKKNLSNSWYVGELIDFTTQTDELISEDEEIIENDENKSKKKMNMKFFQFG